MYSTLISVFLLSTASFVKVEGYSVQIPNGQGPSIDEQVAPLGTGNVFCLFTYGNWVMPSEMKGDVPTAVYAGVARLPYHRLDFSYFSADLNGNYPTIVPDCGYEVWGSVYLIPVQDLDTVLAKGGIVDDKKVFRFVQTVVEAYSNGKAINVKCNAFRHEPAPEKLIYGLPIPHDRRPSQQILDMMIESYTDGCLPKKYIDEISQIPTREQDYIRTSLEPVPRNQPQKTQVPVVVVPSPKSPPSAYAVPPQEHEDIVIPPVSNQNGR